MKEREPQILTIILKELQIYEFVYKKYIIITMLKIIKNVRKFKIIVANPAIIFTKWPNQVTITIKFEKRYAIYNTFF